MGELSQIQVGCGKRGRVGRGPDLGGTWEGGQIQVGHGKGGRGSDLGGTWEGWKGVRSRWDLGRVEGGQI